MKASLTKSALPVLYLMFLFVTYAFGSDNTSTESMAKSYGWLSYLQLGQKIIQKVSESTPTELKKFDVTAYRDEKVAFCATAAPPGATNDLITDKGFYLRVISPEGKDYRPHAVMWSVVICGKILQVLPENKIIVIEVDASNWRLLDTY